MLADLTQFVHDHRPHGSLTADATLPAWNGYLLTVACSCGSYGRSGRINLAVLHSILGRYVVDGYQFS